MEKTLLLIRGVSGAGKSTLADLFYDNLDFATVAADDYWGPNYDFDFTKLHLAHHWCQLSARQLLESGTSVIVHNTATTEKDVAIYQSIAKEHGAKFISIIVENRHGSDSVHGVPQEVRAAQESKLRASIKLI
ncbi:MAG: AAA family ATPase [Phocaeicola sp.]